MNRSRGRAARNASYTHGPASASTRVHKSDAHCLHSHIHIQLDGTLHPAERPRHFYSSRIHRPVLVHIHIDRWWLLVARVMASLSTSRGPPRPRPHTHRTRHFSATGVRAHHIHIEQQPAHLLAARFAAGRRHLYPETAQQPARRTPQRLRKPRTSSPMPSAHRLVHAAPNLPACLQGIGTGSRQFHNGGYRCSLRNASASGRTHAAPVRTSLLLAPPFSRSSTQSSMYLAAPPRRCTGDSIGPQRSAPSSSACTALATKPPLRARTLRSHLLAPLLHLFWKDREKEEYADGDIRILTPRRAVEGKPDAQISHTSRVAAFRNGAALVALAVSTSLPTLQARTLSYLEKAEEKKRGKKEGWIYEEKWREQEGQHQAGKKREGDVERVEKNATYLSQHIRSPRGYGRLDRRR
ncbi:hypothetical protein B0H13DRAFT_2326078 [Mycena leptocephala]|nr:hypothetical protein B0H13DRAFT_2326078 [Mycena leptocephala]